MADKRRKFELSEELQNRLQMIAKTTGQSVQSALSHSLFLGTNVFLGRGQTGVIHDPNPGSQENFHRGQLGVTHDPKTGFSLACASNEPINIGSYTEKVCNNAGEPKRKKRTKKKNELDEGEKFSLQVIFDLWNSTVKSLPRVHGNNKSRLDHAKARQKEGYDLGELFAKVEASDFLTGRKPNEQNWSANFDWVLRPTNCPRIAEGQFDNTEKPNDHFNDARFDPDGI